MDFAKLQAKMAGAKASMEKKVATIKPQPGANRYIILPGWRAEDRETLYHDFGQHFIKNEADEIQAVYPCLEATYGQSCPICSGIASAMKSSSDDATIETLKGARSSRSYLFNVLALDSAEPATPKILEVRQTVLKGIVAAIEEWGEQLFNPETPQILTVNRDGKGLNTKYAVQVSPKKVKMPADILNKLNNLDDYVKQTNEEQERKALGAIREVAGLISAPKPAQKAALAELDDDDAALRSVEISSKNISAAAATPAMDAEISDLLGELDAA